MNQHIETHQCKNCGSQAAYAGFERKQKGKILFWLCGMCGETTRTKSREGNILVKSIKTFQNNKKESVLCQNQLF